jgi:hypothetical protein
MTAKTPDSNDRKPSAGGTNLVDIHGKQSQPVLRICQNYHIHQNINPLGKAWVLPVNGLASPVAVVVGEQQIRIARYSETPSRLAHLALPCKNSAISQNERLEGCW